MRSPHVPAGPERGERVRNHDLVFLQHFSMVILFLVGVAAILMVFAHYLHGEAPVEVNPLTEQRTLQRIQPLSGVYAGETGAAAMAAAAAAARAAAAGQVAYDGTLDGSVIFSNLCGACHTSGAGGAPMMQKSLWTERMAKGVDALVQNAIEGYQGEAGLMPARGGNPSLTDAQVEATVKWMLDNMQ
jgi:cytochrome c5